ncbi:YqjD family protein [Undibacterium arcticum]|uniref:YqjD family protein n=1 Tax=Undibacterium arcticum TaxID=1762892 RepID=A0ABV7FBF6_9BURK
MEPFEKFTPGAKPNPGTLAANVDQVSAGAHTTIDKVADAARPAVDQIASGAHQAVDTLAGAAETLSTKGDQLKEVQARLMEEARVYVRENPVTSLGIAAGVGYLLSRLFSSR